jgi:hypothetical protein
VNAAHEGRDNLKENTMTTTHPTTSTRRRITAATMLIAAGAVAAAGLGAAATANARPIVPNLPGKPGIPAPVKPASPTQYSAIALSAETGVWATWVNAGSRNDAYVQAQRACQAAGGSQCVVTDIAVSKCTALAVDAVNFELWHTGQGPTLISSQTAALQANGGGRIATVACSNGGAPMSFTGHVNQLSGT